MWKDTREDRLNRYKQILQQCPELYCSAARVADKTSIENDSACVDIACENDIPENVKEKEGIAGSEFPENAEEKIGLAGSGFFEDENEAEKNVYDYVLAPALHGFVCWVLREAVAAGTKRLYFLARDGYLMYQAADKICKKLQLPISCKYLSCSRYSIRVPMYHRNYTEALEYICRGGIDLTMDRILNRGALEEQEKQNVLEMLNEEFQRNSQTMFQMQENIPYAKLEQIRQALEKNVYFRNCLESHSREALPGFEGYLEQEGLLDDIPSALVDSGWIGSMQKVLNDAIHFIKEKRAASLTDVRQTKPLNEVKTASGAEKIISEKAASTAEQTNDKEAASNIELLNNTEITDNRGTDLEGYYWGLYELPEDVDPKKYHCYYFSPGERIREKVYFSNSLFETIFSAPHGMTMGYCKMEDGYAPVYAEISEQQYHFMKKVEGHMLRYIEKMLPNIHSEADLLCENDRKTIFRLLRIFMGEPTEAEVEQFGNHRFSDDVLDDGNRQIAEVMTEEELTSNHIWNKIKAMCGLEDKYIRESAWYEGSAVRNGQHVKRHLHRYAAYKYLLYLRKKRLWRKNYG